MSKIEFKTTKKGSGNPHTHELHTWDLTNQLRIEDVLNMKEFSKFKFAGEVKESNNTSGFIIDLVDEFKDKKFIIYLLVIDGYVLKGGKSKNSLDRRTYSAGTEESWTMRGTPSDTNYVWSQIFRSVLKEGNKNIEFYGYIVPTIQIQYESFNGDLVSEEVCGQYETEEIKLNHILKKLKNGNLIGEGSLLTKNKGYKQPLT